MVWELVVFPTLWKTQGIREKKLNLGCLRVAWYQLPPNIEKDQVSRLSTEYSCKKNTHLTSPFLLPAVLRRLEHCSEDWPADAFFFNPKFCGGFGVLGSQNWIQKRKLTWKGTDTDEFPLANCKNARLANKNHCLPFVGGFISSPSSGLENRFLLCLFVSDLWHSTKLGQQSDEGAKHVLCFCLVFWWQFIGSPLFMPIHIRYI